MRLFSVAAAVLMFSLASIGGQSQGTKCGQFPEAGFDSPETSSYVARYSNPNYLFAVTIPQGFVGHSSPPPNPQHGFGVVLSGEPRAYFWFNSGSNGGDWQNEREVLADYLKWLRADAEQIIGVQQRVTRLGPQPARELIARYLCSGSTLERVEVNIVSIRRSALLDESGLLTTAGRFQTDYRMFLATVATWRSTGKY
jgi:hypothetical protein